MIRLANHKEALEILNEPQNQQSVGMISETLFSQPWICSQDGLKMMFVFWMVEDGVCEAHIACSKKAIIKSRLLAKELISWIFTFGVKRIITSCPAGIISNMAEKIGMNKYKSVGNTNHYEVLSWQ